MYLQFYYHKMLVKYNLTTFISKMLIEEVLTASITAIYVNEKMHRTSIDFSCTSSLIQIGNAVHNAHKTDAALKMLFFSHVFRMA